MTTVKGIDNTRNKVVLAIVREYAEEMGIHSSNVYPGYLSPIKRKYLRSQVYDKVNEQYVKHLEEIGTSIDLDKYEELLSTALRDEQCKYDICTILTTYKNDNPYDRWDYLLIMDNGEAELTIKLDPLWNKDKIKQYFTNPNNSAELRRIVDHIIKYNPNHPVESYKFTSLKLTRYSIDAVIEYVKKA